MVASAAAIAAGLFIGGRVVDAIIAHADGDGSPPRLEIAARQSDLGSVQSGVALDASFHVVNRGGRRLILHQANGNCNCIKPGSAAVIVPPGEAATLAPHLETTGLAGPLKLEVRYKTNDPLQLELKLFILVDVKR